MAKPNIRRICATILREWEESSRFIDAIIEHRCAAAKLEPRDRAFVHKVTLGVIRNLALLDYWIDELRKGQLGADERRLLQLGLYQVVLMRVPDHAAVNETVELARQRARPVINAVLRRAARERDELMARADSLPPADRHSIPDHIYERWVEQLDEARADELAALASGPAPIVVRSNLLAGGLTDTDLADCGARAVPDYESFYIVESLPHEALEKGRCYAQDPSTALAPELLAVRPGDRVLDACAAPGGKTAIMAAAMGEKAELVAVDASSKRAERLAGNLDRLKVRSARVEVHDWLKDPLPGWAQVGSFDRILVDAPCSNTGVLRRRADARWRLVPGFAASLASLQGRLLRALLPLLKPGGRLVYSTCSIDAEENGQVVAALLSEEPGLKLIDEQLLLPGPQHDGAYSAAIERLVGGDSSH